MKNSVGEILAKLFGPSLISNKIADYYYLISRHIFIVRKYIAKSTDQIKMINLLEILMSENEVWRSLHKLWVLYDRNNHSKRFIAEIGELLHGSYEIHIVSRLDEDTWTSIKTSENYTWNILITDKHPAPDGYKRLAGKRPSRGMALQRAGGGNRFISSMGRALPILENVKPSFYEIIEMK